MRKRSVLSGTNEASAPEMCPGKLEAGRLPLQLPRLHQELMSHCKHPASARFSCYRPLSGVVLIPDKQRNICIANSNISLASLREREQKRQP